MKKLISFLIIIFAVPGFADTAIEWNQKFSPEIFYLFREQGDQFGNHEENSQSQQKSFELVNLLIKEARATGQKFILPVFFRLDLKQRKVLEGGLQLAGKISPALMKKIKSRAAGNFLTAEFTGKVSGVDSVFKILPGKLRELSLKLSSQEAFLYKRMGKELPESYLLLFPLEKK